MVVDALRLLGLSESDVEDSEGSCLVGLLSCLVLWWALVEFLAVVGLVLVLVWASRWRIC